MYMKCISPINLKNPRKGVSSAIMSVPCGKCGSCRHNRRVDWSFRIKQEFLSAISANFLTLTYSDENLKYGDGVPSLDKTDVQKFLKRFRKENAKHTKRPLRYYAVGEYGTQTGRPHYHLCIFNHDMRTLDRLNHLWPLGHTDIGQITDASIHYITKYHVNFRKDYEDRAPEFALMSRRPGLGINYVEKNSKWHTENENGYVINNGFKQRMPRYYKDKIFDDWTKRKIALYTQDSVREAYEKEINRLRELGHGNPELEIEYREFVSSLKVETKAAKEDKI